MAGRAARGQGRAVLADTGVGESGRGELRGRKRPSCSINTNKCWPQLPRRLHGGYPSEPSYQAPEWDHQVLFITYIVL
uniref:Uncharacterized protein n=1 Tax=Triticum aestivum TaxID=4565 RepID=A0A3B6KPA9_WHEAT